MARTLDQLLRKRVAFFRDGFRTGRVVKIVNRRCVTVRLIGGAGKRDRYRGPRVRVPVEALMIDTQPCGVIGRKNITPLREWLGG